MNERKCMAILQKAYESFERSDMGRYRQHLDMARAAMASLPKTHPLWGEYLFASSFEYQRDLDRLIVLYQEALDLIGGRSQLMPLGPQMFGRYFHIFGICNPELGHADENIKKIERATALFNKLTGGGSGTDICYRAQLAYYRGELREAYTLAQSALNIALKNDQTLVALCAAEMLSQVAKHEEDYELWHFALGFIRFVADNDAPEMKICREHAQIILATSDLCLGILHRVPDWIKDSDFGAIPLEGHYEVVDKRMSFGTISHALAARIEYYCYGGQPIKALNSIYMTSKVYCIDSRFFDLYMDFLSAACYLQLNREEQMIKALEQGIEKVAKDGLWLLAAEFEPAFGKILLDIVARYDAGAVVKVRRLSKDFLKKLAQLRKSNLVDASVRLTNREREIAGLIVQGRSNAEIADKLCIAERTVKCHLEHIYRKLNINRRSGVAVALRQARATELAVWVRRQTK